MTESEIVQNLLDRLKERENSSIVLDKLFAPDYTPPDPICEKMSTMLFKLNPNMFVPSFYPTVQECFEDALKFLSQLFHQPVPCGEITIGSTEGILNAIEAASRRYQKPLHIIAPVSAHMSLHKTFRYKNISDQYIHWINVDYSCQPDVEKMINLASRLEPCFIFTTAGTVDFGTIDPIQQIAEGLKGRDVWLHVDAASGGMIFPFLDETKYLTDFSIPGVCSLTVDIHKRGLAPLPCSFVLFRHPEDLERLCEGAAYTKSFGCRYSFTGSFPGISAVWAWALFEKYGYDGYSRLVQETMAKRTYLAEALLNHGIEIFPETKIPTVVIPVKQPQEITEKLSSEYGIKTGGYSIQPCQLQTEHLRIGIMPHNTFEGIETLAKILLTFSGSYFGSLKSI